MNTKDESTSLPSQLRLAADIEERRQKGEDVKWQWMTKVTPHWHYSEGASAAKCVADGYEIRLTPSSHLPNGLVWSGTEWKMPWKPKFKVGDKVIIKRENPNLIATVVYAPINEADGYRLEGYFSWYGNDELLPAPLDDPALLESIEHWTRLATGKRKEGEVPSRAYCALCTEYWGVFDTRCNGCPVKAKTGKSICVGSPYEVAAQNWNTYGLDSPQFLTAAQKELDFLISLKVENQGRKVDVWVPKFKKGDEVMYNNVRRIVVNTPREGVYQVKNVEGVMFFADETDLSPAPFNLHAHVRKSFPTLAEDVKFHREDWTEDMLSMGYRPTVEGEKESFEHEYKYKDKSWKNSMGTCAQFENKDYFYRTRRPLPTPRKLVPLTAEDWMKDGPWWVRQINSSENPWLVVRATQLSESSPTTMERSNDGITWTKCGKQEVQV